MNFKRVHSMAMAIAILASGASASAQTPTNAQIQEAKSRISAIKNRVDRLIELGQQGGSEDDFLAAQRLSIASGSLFNAGERADQALFAMAPAVKAVRFAQCCTATGLARSQVARARLAALLPPVGILTPLAGEFSDIVNELNLLRQPFPVGVGCP